MATNGTHFIVFANEKGGTGKSTTAVHTAVALAAAGRTVATLDLDERQRTTTRYLENRAQTIKRLGVELPMPIARALGQKREQAEFDAALPSQRSRAASRRTA